MNLKKQACYIDIQRYGQSMRMHHCAFLDQIAGKHYAQHHVSSKKRSLPLTQQQHSTNLAAVSSSFRLPTISGLASRDPRTTAQGDPEKTERASHNVVLPPSCSHPLEPRQSDPTLQQSDDNRMANDSQSFTQQIITMDHRFRSFDTSSPFRALPPPTIQQTPCVLSYPSHIDSPEQNLGSFQVKRRTSFDDGILPYGTQHIEALKVSRYLKTRLKDCFNSGLLFHTLHLPRDVQYNRGQVRRKNPQGIGPMSRYVEGPRKVWRGTESAKELKRGLRAMDARVLLGVVDEDDKYTIPKALISNWVNKWITGKESEWYIRRKDTWVDEGAVERELDESLLGEFFEGNSLKRREESKDRVALKEQSYRSCAIERIDGEIDEVDEMVLL